MDVSEALAELRHVLYESSYDGAWSDILLTSYLSEGQDRFCEDVGLFIDPVSFKITTEAGVDSYKLNSRIIRVLNARIGNRELTRYDEKHGNVVRGQYGGGGIEPEFYRTDVAPGYITFASLPQDAYTVHLRVWRYALCPLEESGEFELPYQFRRACIEYAAYKALNHHDMELQDPIKARDHYQIYRDYVARGKDWIHNLLGATYEVVPNQQYVV